MTAPITDIHHLRTLARLRRVNEQLALWDKLDAMSLMPPSLRPHAEAPVLDREVLKELRGSWWRRWGEGGGPRTGGRAARPALVLHHRLPHVGM